MSGGPLTSVTALYPPDEIPEAGATAYPRSHQSTVRPVSPAENYHGSERRRLTDDMVPP